MLLSSGLKQELKPPFCLLFLFADFFWQKVANFDQQLLSRRPKVICPQNYAWKALRRRLPLALDVLHPSFSKAPSPCEALRADPQKSNIQPTLCLPRLLSATCLTWSRTQLALFARETQFWELSKQYKIENANTWETLVLLCKKTGSKLIYLESMPHLYWKGKNKKAM